MQPLNAIDAITPAFTRTHQTLFQPFRFGRSWKLAASQYLGFVGAMFIPAPLFVFLIPANLFPGFAAARAILFAGSLVVTLVALIVLYFCARMELVCFEMIVTRGKFIAPMWRRYSRRIWPWFGLKLLVGTLFSALVALIFYLPIRHLILDMAQATPIASIFTQGQHPDPDALNELMAPILQRWINLQLLSVALFFVLKIPSTLLNDFVLPFFVLEDISLTEALRRGLNVFLADPLGVLAYLVLKPILSVIGYLINYAVTLIAIIPLSIIFGIVVAVAGVASFSVHHATAASAAAGGLAFGAGTITLGVLFIAAMIYVTFFTVGYLLALLEAYGIYFLAGRYPLLGNLLEPGPGKPFTPPPVFPSDEERRNSDGGPPMPMDPAVA